MFTYLFYKFRFCSAKMAAPNTIFKVCIYEAHSIPYKTASCLARKTDPSRTQMRLSFIGPRLTRRFCLPSIFCPPKSFTTSFLSSPPEISHASPLPAGCSLNMAAATSCGLASSTPTYHSQFPDQAHSHRSAASTSPTSHTGLFPNTRYGSRTTTAQAT